ncbi:MAG TPA: lmo0937 family membrane protein [Candidatus Limnocylindrales bacterium]
MASLLWLIVVVLVVLWLIGLVAGIAGFGIHLLLVIALVVILYNLLVGRRTA